ncbi:hypothetical protein JCM5350_001210 [Sporobolomyces pararoseus]
MSTSRRSSFPGICRLPTFLSPSPPTVAESELERPKSSPPQSLHELVTNVFERPSAEATETTSPSSTIRPRHRRFSSSTTIQAGPSEPIPISPPISPLLGPNYLAQRQANLDWAIRHKDHELIRTERAAIERYKQELAESFGLSLEEGGSTGCSSQGTGSIESFEIPIRDTSQTSSCGGLKYSTGRRMSCLANYEGLPVPRVGESSDYFVALGGRREEGERTRGYRYSPVGIDSSGCSSTRRSPVRTSDRRASSPFRPSGMVAPFSPLFNSQPSSALDDDPSASDSKESSFYILPNPSTTSESEGKEQTNVVESPLPFRPPSTESSAPLTPPTRIIHGFHIDSSSTSSTSSESPSPSASSQAQSIRPPTPPSTHSICRGRAGSVSFIGGLGCGNVQQERMELQASRDIEVLDREALKREKRGVSRDSKEGVARVRGGRTKDGKVAAAERLRKGYSGEYQLHK